MFLAVVRRAESRRTRNRRTMVQVDVSDGSGYLRCTFFNQPWRAKQLTPGTSAVFFGKLDHFGGRRAMTNPVVDLLVDRTTAMRGIHLPESTDEAQAARKRLVFDELLRTQVALVRRKRRLETTA